MHAIVVFDRNPNRRASAIYGIWKFTSDFFFQDQTSTHAILREKRDYKSEGQSNWLQI
jgi:hypothetical protein